VSARRTGLSINRVDAQPASHTLRFSSRGTLEPTLNKRAANPTGRQDRGYGVTSALALVVEAVEALALPLRL
jgi:hypothetical protein